MLSVAVTFLIAIRFPQTLSAVFCLHVTVSTVAWLINCVLLRARQAQHASAGTYKVFSALGAMR